jgi:hypothetical protein
VNTTCIDNNTLQVNTSYIGEGSANFTLNTSKEIYCINGCVNNACIGTSVSPDTSQIWMVFSVGTAMLLVATILGLPIGQESDIRKGFNFGMVVKYIFFFVGIFLVYLSMGMMRKIGVTYSGDIGISGGMDTAVMTMMITMILFIIVFVVEFFFNTLKFFKEHSMDEMKKKRGEEE